MVPLFSLFKGSVYCSLSAKSKPISEVSTLALPWPVFAMVLWAWILPGLEMEVTAQGSLWGTLLLFSL